MRVFAQYIREVKPMKKRLFALAVIIICLSLTAYGTLAYFSSENTAHNVITSSSVDIQLQEWADEDKTVPFPEEGVSGVMPGTEVTKIAEVKNTGPEPVWVRVSVEKIITLAEGVEGDVNVGLLLLDFNQEYWTLADGFYYYNQPLNPGETTVELFASVAFDPAMDNIYQNSTASVVVTAYAVQTANNGSSALEAAGWPAP